MIEFCISEQNVEQAFKKNRESGSQPGGAQQQFEETSF